MADGSLGILVPRNWVHATGITRETSYNSNVGLYVTAQKGRPRIYGQERQTQRWLPYGLSNSIDRNSGLVLVAISDQSNHSAVRL